MPSAWYVLIKFWLVMILSQKTVSTCMLVIGQLKFDLRIGERRIWAVLKDK